MDRRKFTALIAGGLLFPRKSESSPPEEGLSHEQVAQAILTCPRNVHLFGTSYYLGKTRNYHYADKDSSFDCIVEDSVSEWSEVGGTIGSDSTWGEPVWVWRTRSRSVVGSRVVVQTFDGNHRMGQEEWFEISNPSLKAIHLIGDYDWQNARYFARFGERWIEST